jgi:hypothetical protein
MHEIHPPPAPPTLRHPLRQRLVQTRFASVALTFFGFFIFTRRHSGQRNFRFP